MIAVIISSQCSTKGKNLEKTASLWKNDNWLLCFNGSACCCCLFFSMFSLFCCDPDSNENVLWDLNQFWMNDLLCWFISGAVIYFASVSFPGLGQDVCACLRTSCVRILTLLPELPKTILLEQPDVLPALYWTILPHLRDKLQASDLAICSVIYNCRTPLGSSDKYVPAFPQVRSDAVFEEWWEVACFHTYKLIKSELILFSKPAPSVTLLGKEALQELISQGIRD